MRSYLEAGADIAFVEGLEDAEAIRRAAAALAPAPLLLNASMSAHGLPLPLDDMAGLGVRIVIYPGDAQRAAIAGIHLLHHQGARFGIGARQALFE